MSMIGELQLGRVPAGKSSALRTIGGMSLIAGQGEARPERILRRFFLGLAQVWSIMHEQNKYFLPKEKQIQKVGFKNQSDDPYQTISQRTEINAQMQFEFKANVLNTSKQAMQQAIGAMLGTYVNGIAIQMGIIDEAGVYRLFRDFGKAWGQDPDRYLTEPIGGSLKPRIFAQEALSLIFQSQRPDGRPAEAGGAIEHFQKLQAFFESDNIGLMLKPAQLEVFNIYLNQVGEAAALQQQRQQLVQAADSFAGQGGNGEGGGRPPEGGAVDNSPATISGGGELLDESLPGAGGGANPGGVQ